MKTQSDNRPSARRLWLVPLLWLVVPALAAVAPWAWRRIRSPRQVRHVAMLPLALTGDPRRDREVILERAADRLLSVGTVDAPLDDSPPARTALLGEIGVELMPLNTARGTVVVQRAIEAATRPADRVSAADLDAPERTRIGMLIHLAQSLRHYPTLAEQALATASVEAQGNKNAESRIYALCLFAREAARIDPARARSAVRKAVSTVALLPADAPPDPLAAAASAMARVDGAAAARPLVERALRAIPSGRARPLVEARWASWLAEAAPARALDLAQQAVADIGVQGFRGSGAATSKTGPSLSTPNARTPERPNARTPEPLNDRQQHDVAVLLAVAYPDVALAAAGQIRAPEARAGTLVDMGAACEARKSARAEALFRRALREAGAIPDRQQRQQTVIAAASGLAAYDLTAAYAAVRALHAPVPAIDVMMLGVRAAKREPAAALRLIEGARDGDPATAGTIEGSHDISLAEVTAEPDLRRALAMAQQARSPELQAETLLVVARRLEGQRRPRQ